MCFHKITSRLLRFLSFRTIILCIIITQNSFLASCQPKTKDIIDTTKIQYGACDETCFGPFDSWGNVKIDFGAVGDGKTDDTKAIQKALDMLKYTKRRILFFPAGTYIITKTLIMVSQMNIGIMGEDPATTTIKWDGNVGETMLDCNGVSYSHFGRITWDGAMKAGTAIEHGWDGKRPQANTDGEHADEVFKNVGIGIRGGSRKMMDAECVVKRCRFENCSKAGISIENFNACDWQIWQCTFQHCLLGVTNTYGAGYFNVYYCYFIGSLQADLAKYHCGYFAARHNTSINSACFFIAYTHACPGLVTLQDNKIYYPTGQIAIALGDAGPALLLDNLIVSRPENNSKPVIFIKTWETTLSMGNSFTTKTPIQDANNAIATVSDKIISQASVKIDLPIMPGTAPLLKIKAVDVPYGSDEVTIQHLLDSAVAHSNKDVVLHFAAGNYYLSSTIVVPANRKITFVGDGFDSHIIWKTALHHAGIMFKLMGPSLAIMRQLELNANNDATGIEINNCDQKGARVFMDQGQAKGSLQTGLLVDSLDNTDVYLKVFYHEGCKQTSVKVVGGINKAQGVHTDGRVSIYCGASSNNKYSYDLRNNANLLVNDIWYEGAPPGFFYLSDSSSGNFTFNGGVVATGGPPKTATGLDSSYAALLVDGFKGNISILNVDLRSSLYITKKTKDADVLSIVNGWNTYYRDSSNNKNVVFWGSTRSLSGGGGQPIVGLSKPSDSFLSKMLQQQRTQLPTPLINLPKDVTDVRIYRVNVRNSTTGFHLKH